MQVSHFHCPHCSALLRIRDESLFGTWLDCPDCTRPMHVERQGQAEVAARTPDEPDPPSPRDDGPAEPETEPAARPADPSRPRTELDARPRELQEPATDGPPLPRFGQALRRLASPLLIAWVTAAIVTATLVVVMLDPFGSRQAAPSGPSAGDAASENEGRNPDRTVVTAEDRLRQLGERTLAFREREGRLPRAASLDGGREPLSWLARLESHSSRDAAAEPDWSKPWKAPANAPFVRRVLPHYQNPAVEQKSGPQGYPATHFVGMGGVGADAPTLPPDHGRAGMFGYGRAARPEDVRDGLSNTIMVAGVRRKLGSWSAAGPATVRPFTQEPYVNGPDGFGTGDPDGMLVLMGDGSVRSASAKTDPRVLRRMAAMADGLDLELEQPGEPGDAPQPETPDDPPDAIAEVDDEPQPMPPQPDQPEKKPQDPDDVELPFPDPDLPVPEPEPEPVDVAARLKQPLASYETRTPVRLADALLEFGEILGVPVRYDEDELGEALLQRRFSVSVERTTVGEVLRRYLEKAGLTWDVEADGIYVRPVDDAESED